MSNRDVIAGDTPIVNADQITKTYGSGDLAVSVLRDVTFEVPSRSLIGVVGASGSGKSTLLHLLGGLDFPDHGSVSICGESLARISDARRGYLRNQHLGFVYQFHHLLPEFTAVENIAMPLLIRKYSAQQARSEAMEMLTMVGLEKRAGHKPSELSGGERQRVAIARALVTRPEAVLADEPTGNLDRKNAMQVMELMLRLNEQLGTSLVIVTHDMELAQRMRLIYTIEDGVLQPMTSMK